MAPVTSGGPRNPRPPGMTMSTGRKSHDRPLATGTRSHAEACDMSPQQLRQGKSAPADAGEVADGTWVWSAGPEW
ncbi:hypothetical protein GCM10017711_40160 [Paeniglutamicibacter sulfureus]